MNSFGDKIITSFESRGEEPRFTLTCEEIIENSGELWTLILSTLGKENIHIKAFCIKNSSGQFCKIIKRTEQWDQRNQKITISCFEHQIFWQLYYCYLKMHLWNVEKRATTMGIEKFSDIIKKAGLCQTSGPIRKTRVKNSHRINVLSQTFQKWQLTMSDLCN